MREPNRSLVEYQTFHREIAASWEALGEGGPTLAAIAALCARALAEGHDADNESQPLDAGMLCPEAQAILFLAKSRGIIEVRGVKTAFAAPGRLLAIYVEVDEHQTVAFRSQIEPAITVRFFDGFCQLCRAGLIIHHLHRDFTLSRRGFELAGQIDGSKIQPELNCASDFGLHEH